MSGSNSSISQTSYKQDLINYLSSKANFSGFNFKGSNIDLLLDLLDYNTQRNAAYQNMTFAESYLDSAQLYTNITSRAKELGYIAKSATASKAILNLNFNVTDNITNFVLPAGFLFNAKSSNTTYNFQTLEDIIVSNNNGNFIANNVTVVEGFPVTETFIYNTDQNIYILSNPLVDTSTITVNIQSNSSNTQNTMFIQANNLIDINSNSNIFYAEPTFNDQYGLVFGDGVFGTALANGNIINTTYYVCNADTPNDLSSFTPVSTAGNGYSCSVTTLQPSAGGALPETSNSIKYRAPRYFRAQNRAITQSDYEVLILDNFIQVKNCNVYGSENTVNGVPGTVYIILLLNNGYTLTTSLVNEITSFIKTKTIEVINVIVQLANIVYITPTVTVYYKPSKTASSSSNIVNSIKNSVINYTNNSLNNFNLNFYASRIEQQLLQINSSFVSVSVNSGLYQSSVINFNTSQYLTVNFQNSVYNSALSDINYPNIYSNPFYYNSNVSLIKDDSNGNLSIYSSNSSAPALKNIGTVDYSNGLINLNGINIQSIVNGSQLILYMKLLDDSVISAINNNILNIDVTKINVNLIATN